MSEHNYYVGLDIGTTNFKAAVVDGNGSMIGLYRETVLYKRSSTGTIRLSPEEFERLIAACIRGACGSAGISTTEISGVGYSSQANTFLLLDDRYEPISDIISWQEYGPPEYPPEVQSLVTHPEFNKQTGLDTFSEKFAVVKLRAMNKTGELSRARRVAMISDYFVYLLTGKLIGDQSTASLLGIFDLPNRRWWSEGLEILGFKEEFFADLAAPGNSVGSVSKAGSERTGLREGTGVAAGGLDHFIAAIGAGAGSVADASESTGTVMACVLPGVGLEDVERSRVADGCAGPGGSSESYYRYAFDSFGGTLLERYREEHHPDLSFAELDELAEAAPPGAGGLVALPGDDGGVRFERLQFSEGDDAITSRVKPGKSAKPAKSAKPEVPGQSERTGCEVRAILEAGALRLRRLIRITSGGDEIRSIVSTGGGARSDIWQSIKASVAGVKMITVETEEPACVGAAYLGARSSGAFAENKGRLSIPSSWTKLRKVYEPDEELTARYRAWIEMAESSILERNI